MTTRQPFRKWGHWKSIGSYSYTQVLSQWSFQFIFKAKLKLESRRKKIKYGHQAAILKLTSLKINRLQPIYTSIMPLKFGVDGHSQTKVRVWKPQNPIWPPGGYFESDIAVNQQADAYNHHRHAYEIWNWTSKANFTYAPETGVQKPTILIWLPGGHFENDVAENQYIYIHTYCAAEVWVWHSKPK